MPTYPFYHTEGPECGRLVVRPHTSFQSRTRAGVWAFAISPTHPPPLPHPSCHLPCVFAVYMETTPSMIASRWQLSLFLPEHVSCHVFCRVHANCTCKQLATLSLSETCYFAMSLCSATRQLPSVRRWQLLKFSNHDNCSKADQTWQLPSISRWQPLNFSNHGKYSKPDHTWQQLQLSKNGIWHLT